MYQQGSDQQSEVHELGAALSLHLPCKSASWPTYGKNEFNCPCGSIIPLWMVKAAVKSGDWSLVFEAHKESLGRYKQTKV